MFIARRHIVSISAKVLLGGYLIIGIAPLIDGYTSTTATAAKSALPLCSGSWLWASYGGSNGAGGTIIYTIALTNVSKHTCRLEGYPRIVGYENGVTRSLRVSHGSYAGNLRPTVLSFRESGRLLLSTADGCNALNTGGQSKIRKVAAANTYNDLGLYLPGGGSVMVSGIKIDVACGLGISQFGWTITNG
jgi:hypothetical protein